MNGLHEFSFRYRGPLIAALASLVASTLLLIVPFPAIADHSSWHAEPHTGELGSSSYWAQAHLLAGDDIDFVGTRVFVDNSSGTTVADKSTSCGPVNEGCGPEQYSPIVYFPQSSHTVYTHICAYDGDHDLPWNSVVLNGVCYNQRTDIDSVNLY